MSCNPILSGFGRSIESHSGDYGTIFSFQRHQSGATNRRYDIMQQTHNLELTAVLNPPLTSISVPVREMGKLAAQKNGGVYGRLKII